MSQDYEIHINIRHTYKALAIAEDHGWKISFIQGPVALDKGDCFLTTHRASEESARAALGVLIGALPTDTVVCRAKIEHVIYDERF